MQAHVKKKHDMDKRPRKLLVGGMKAKKILLLLYLLKWYMDHGLHVTKIYQVIEFSPQSCLREFRETISDARRKGDENSEKLLLRDTMKLLGEIVHNICNCVFLF